MIKGLFRIIFNLIRLIILLGILAIIFHTWVIKQALVFSISYQLGADVSIQEIKMDWKHTGFEIHNLEIGNPYSFPREALATIPLAIVSFDVPILLRGREIRLKALAFDLRELRVMNVAQRGLNILALKPLQEKAADERSSQVTIKQQVDSRVPSLTVDELIISLGDIIYTDTSGPALRQQQFHAGIRGATYYNVRGTSDVAGIIVAEALKRLGFGYLDMKIQKLEDQITPQGGFLTRTLGTLKKKFS